MRLILLILLIIAANRFLGGGEVGMGNRRLLQSGVQGTWQAQTTDYEGYIAEITDSSLLLTHNGRQLCDIEYHYEERTQLITGAYRKDFGPFALFEYQDAAQSSDGRPLLVGSVRSADGTVSDVYFKKIR